jgi:hypothetical protein
MKWSNDLAFFLEVLVQLLRLLYAFIEEEVNKTSCELMSDSCALSKGCDSLDCCQFACGNPLAHSSCI